MTRKIREMSENDWPDVYRIYKDGIETDMATFQRGCPSREDWNASHLKDCRLVITLNGLVAGGAALSPVSGRSVYAGVAEVSVYIDKDHRGQGIGRQLLQELVRLSEEKGFWTLQSVIFQKNTGSIKLHEKCGFRMVGYRERISRDRHGRWQNTVLMERRSKSDDFEVKG